MNLDKLKSETHSFFYLHWPKANGERPIWNHDYNFIGAVPNGDHGGCYALLTEDGEVSYVGSGVSRGRGLYVNHGLGSRLNSHVLSRVKAAPASIADRKYSFQSKWEKCSRLSTLGFPHEYSYLAVALEAYLIRQLKPPHNIVRRG